MSPSDPIYLRRLLGDAVQPDPKRRRPMAPPLVADIVSQRNLMPADATAAPGPRPGPSDLERVGESAMGFGRQLRDHPLEFVANTAPITSDLMSMVDAGGLTANALRSALGGNWKEAMGSGALAGLSLAGALPNVPRLAGLTKQTLGAADNAMPAMKGAMKDARFAKYSDDEWDALRDELEDRANPLDDDQRAMGLSRRGYEMQDAVSDFVEFAKENASQPVEQLLREWKKFTGARPANAKRVQTVLREYLMEPPTP